MRPCTTSVWMSQENESKRNHRREARGEAPENFMHAFPDIWILLGGPVSRQLVRRFLCRGSAKCTLAEAKKSEVPFPV